MCRAENREDSVDAVAHIQVQGKPCIGHLYLVCTREIPETGCVALCMTDVLTIQYSEHRARDLYSNIKYMEFLLVCYP